MKIIYVENVRIPSERAHAYQIAQTCAGFARLGQDVTLVNPDRADSKDVFSWFGLPANLFQHVRLRAWDPLSTAFPAKKVTYALQRAAFTQVLRRWAKTQKADVWYTRDVAMIDALRGVVNGPWILESHDRPDTDRARWDRVQPLISGYVAISRGMAEELKLLNVPDKKILIAHDGYDPKEFQSLPSRSEARQALGLAEADFVAIYAGSFYEWKGVDLAVSAWIGTLAHWHLVLIGGPDGDRRRLERHIAPSVRERVHILPTRSREDVIALFSAADVGLLLSSPEHEIAHSFTSPLKQFEYLAAGLPILATDVPSSHELLDDSVARFCGATPSAFRSVLESMEADADWRKEAHSIGPRIVAPYTWDGRADLIFEFIETCLFA